jgi:MFS family permease
MSLIQDDRLDPALRRLIGVILLGGALGILNSTMVAVGIDRLASEFDASLSTVGWVSTGFLLAVTVTIPVTAWAGDSFGGKRMWLAGLGVFLLGSLGCGLAWDAGSLIVFRVLQGVGAGILDPLVLTLLARAAGPARAGRVMGLMAAVLSLGPVLGPVVGGVVLQGMGWRWMFLLSVPIGVVALVLARRVMPATSPRRGRGRVSTSSASPCSVPASRACCSCCRRRRIAPSSSPGRCSFRWWSVSPCWPATPSTPCAATGRSSTSGCSPVAASPRV